MNERIKLLAERAEILITDVGVFHNTPAGAYQLKGEHLAKFAQLIVNECYNRAESQYHHSGDEWDKGVAAVMDSIEELFRS